MPTRRKKNPSLPAINPRPLTIGDEARVTLPLPPARALPAVRATPPMFDPARPTGTLPAPATYPRTIVGAESTGPQGTLEDLLAKRQASLQAADLYPSSTITRNEQGYEIAPPLPPGQKPSRFKAFLKGMGQGARLGAGAGIGGIVGGALTGGVEGAISPDYVNRQAHREDALSTEGRIGTALGIENKQAQISAENAQAVLRTAQARNAIRFPNITTKPLELPNGGPTIQMQPSVGPDGTVVWEPSQTPGGGVVTSKAAEPRFNVEVGGQNVSGLKPAEAATALAARGRTELDEREFQYKQEKDKADRQIEQAKAAIEAGATEDGLNYTQSAASIYRNNANTSNQEVQRLQQEIASHGDAVDPTSGVSFIDSPEGQVLVSRLKAAQGRADSFDKAATDAEQSIPGLMQKLGGARGRAKAYAQPKANPAKSGAFNRYE